MFMIAQNMGWNLAGSQPDRIADLGLRIADCGLIVECGLRIAD